MAIPTSPVALNWVRFFGHLCTFIGFFAKKLGSFRNLHPHPPAFNSFECLREPFCPSPSTRLVRPSGSDLRSFTRQVCQGCPSGRSFPVKRNYPHLSAHSRRTRPAGSDRPTSSSSLATSWLCQRTPVLHSLGAGGTRTPKTRIRSRPRPRRHPEKRNPRSEIRDPTSAIPMSPTLAHTVIQVNN